MTASSVRPLLVWLVTTLGCALAIHWALGDPAAVPSASQALITRAAGWALAACAVWCWFVTTAVVAGALRRSSPDALLPGVPPWARRVVLAACGLALVGSGTAVAETPGGLAHQPVSGDPVVAGLRLPDRTVGPALGPDAPAVGSARGTDTAVGGPRGTRGSRVVRPGDSLWSIASDLAGPGASTPQVAALSAELYRLNRALVGPDPDLVLPGQVLRTPTTAPQP